MCVAAVANYGINIVCLVLINKEKKNPGVYKYLFNKASVDNIEWVPTSSNNYLSTNKVPKPSTFW